ncbi:hypothetical protein PIB30_051904 [Stylosanthes scabra]|uniref:Lachrymatory factor synthase n=1 Tax=Stylosanthes scabra TaxID=79078 RepID=A0ABU6YFF1_9FABA|nr:hypothetical protein [Stylosanthes scabra]
MAEESNGSKWEGKSIVELQSTSANQAWPLLEDFFNIHNLIPIDTCYQVESVEGHAGPTRYCASAPKGAHGGADDDHVLWVKERLLSVEHGQRCLSYDVVDGNLGFKNYVGTIKVVPSSLEGCKIEWSFVSDPLETWSFKDLNSYIDSSLQFMAKKIELACSKGSV